MEFSTVTASGKERQTEDGSGRFIAKLLGLKAAGIGERKPKLDPFDAELMDSADASRPSGKQHLPSDKRAKGTGEGKRRVRRRCYLGQHICVLPTRSSQISLLVADSSIEGKASQTRNDKGRSKDLTKLLNLKNLDTSERKQNPNPFSSELVKSSDVSSLSSKMPVQSAKSTKGTGQGKRSRRVRRRCHFGQWPCPTGSSRKQLLP